MVALDIRNLPSHMPLPLGAVPKVGPLARPRDASSSSMAGDVVSGHEKHHVTVLWVLFFVLKRTRRGPRERGGGAEHLLLSNHQSMLDSCGGPRRVFSPVRWRPHLIPWNPRPPRNLSDADSAWLADNWEVHLVRGGRRDLHALHRMIELLPSGVMRLFPEGTRTRDGSVGPGQAGPGLLILATKAG